MSTSTIGTFTGLRVDPLALTVDDIDIEDIAHALSMQCRFGGHVSQFYSVAQHSVAVSQNVPPGDALWGLLHDATEAYLVDIPRPLKRSPVFAAYRDLEAQLLTTIAKKFNLPPVLPASVHRADSIESFTEGAAFHHAYGSWWSSEDPDVQPRGGAGCLVSQSPYRAKVAFLTRFMELTTR